MTTTWNAFLDHVVLKLEGMFLQTGFHPGNSSILARFKNLIGKMAQIKHVTETELPVAEGLQFDYQRKAVKAAVDSKLNVLRRDAAQILDSLLEDWEVAKACAEALVAYMTTEKAKKATRRGANATAEELHLRYFVHITLEDGVSPSDFVRKITRDERVEWLRGCSDRAVLENYWALEGQFKDSQGFGKGPVDGVALIIRVDSLSTLSYWMQCLAVNGAKWSSALRMSDIDVPPAAEPQPEPPATIDPMETH